MDHSAVERILRPVDEIEVGWILALAVLALVLMTAVEKALPWIAERLPGRLRGYLLPLVSPLRLLVLAGAILEIAPLVIRPTAENLAILLGTGGVAIGFAFKDYVSSVIAGVVASYERPYRVGDRVEIGGAYGTVRSIGLRSLKLVTHDDTVVTVPHSRIWNDPVRNANDGLREQLCTVDFFLHPDHDPERVGPEPARRGVEQPVPAAASAGGGGGARAALGHPLPDQGLSHRRSR